MKKMLCLAVVVLTAAVMSGCKSNLHEGENYARGKSTGFNFLGFMTVVPVSYSDALVDLYNNAGVKGEQPKLVNYYAEYSSPYFILFSMPTLVVEAEKMNLKDKDCKIIDSNAVGYDKGFKFLGFMDFAPLSFNDALNDLYAKQNLPPGKKYTMTNVYMEQDAMYFILFSLTRLTVRGELIELKNKEAAAPAVPPAPAKIAAPAVEKKAPAPAKAAAPAVKEVKKESGVK